MSAAKRKRGVLPPGNIPARPCIDWSRNRRGECCCLKGNIEERAVTLAQYIIENRTTVRAAAQKFGISKSTVHKDLSERLPKFNRALYDQVKAVLDVNKAQRHIRGMATRKNTKASESQKEAPQSGAPPPLAGVFFRTSGLAFWRENGTIKNTPCAQNLFPGSVRTLNRHVWAAAFRVTVPVLIGYLAIGIAFGLMLEAIGYNFIWSFL